LQILALANALGEYPHALTGDHAALADRIADDVVVEHRADFPAALSGSVGKEFSAPQSLFLTREHRIDDRRAEFPLRQDSRCFQNDGDARCVVIGPRGIGLCIHDVADDRIDMSADDDYAIGIGALLYAEHVDDIHAVGRAWAGEVARDRLAREASAASRADCVELRFRPGPGRADSAFGVAGIG